MGVLKFVSKIVCEIPEERGLWFVFSRGRMLYFGKGEGISIPRLISPSEIGLKVRKPLYLGKADGINCWAAEIIDTDEYIADCCGHAEFDFKSLRELYPMLGDEYFALAGRALQLSNWSSSWIYCPTCGKELEDSKTERAKICQTCSKPYYPVISPAVIVAVSKGNKLLLARNNNFPNRKRYSILAGFVEPGESLEETVAREIEEEVSIQVKNIRYFGSQSWPFPHSLMLGFTAEYESGDIRVDGVEIGDAGWYCASDFPEIPPYGSISRVLIDDFVKRNS